MAALLQKFDEYWQSTASTRQKLIKLQKPKATVLRYEFKVEEAQLEPAGLIYERACILASDMNLPFEWAESIVKLRSIKKPQIIPQNSWVEIKAACSQLYMDDFALLKLIVNNGWLLGDIYGCNELAPFVRVDCMGLLLLLHQGDEVVGVNKERIKILRKTGSIDVFSKSLSPAGERILLHELSS